MDLSIPVSGIPITVTRTYDSRVKTKRDFGVGWSLDIATGSFQHNRPIHIGWNFPDTGPPAFLDCVSGGLPTVSHTTQVRLSDTEYFEFVPVMRNISFGGVGGGCLADVEFVQVDGKRPGAALDIIGDRTARYIFGSGELQDENTGFPFNPRNVQLTTPEGVKVEFELGEGVRRIEDRNGNFLTINSNGITHSSGKGIGFTRDASGRITKLTDPMGYEAQYVYDPAGDLVAFVDQEGNRTEFVYDQKHYLVDIINALGVRAVRNEYDASGRLIAATDALGNTTHVGHDLATRRETLTDRLGYTRYVDYDTRGNVVAEVYPGMGDNGGDATITRTYDGRDNMLTETNELGHTTTRTYDLAGNVLTEADPLGHTSTTTYNQFNLPLTETDPRGFTTTWTYNSSGDVIFENRKGLNLYTFNYDVNKGYLESACDPRGYCRRMEYDFFGNVAKEYDKNGVPILFTYDELGRVTSETSTRSVSGQIESLAITHRYDASGREVETTLADGASWLIAYDPLGRVVESTDPIGRVTRYQVTPAGRPSSTQYPDGTSETFSYDAEDRLVARTDRSGRSRHLTYDARDRLLSASNARWVRRWAYDPAGREVAESDARGLVREQEYDAAGRVVAIRDGLGNEVRSSYDELGNRVTATDQKGRLTEYVFDENSRLTRIDHPDGRSEEMIYDSQGNRLTHSDREAHTVVSAYDGNSNLTSSTNGENETWVFAYDEEGRRVSQADPFGHVTQFAFDMRGREISRRFHVGPEQTRAYDSAGRMLSLTNYSSDVTRYEYDWANNATRREHPDGSSVLMTWTPEGRSLTSLDANGTRSWTYGAEGWLTAVAGPGGRGVSYHWDGSRNLVARDAVFGSDSWTDTFAYDSRSLITQVTAAGELYSLTYDQAGQLQSVEFPNGATTTYGHDALDRIESITVRDPTSEVIASWVYIRALGDNVTRVLASDGSARDLAYDGASRLLEESLTSSTGAFVHLRRYSYDVGGNRTSVTYTPAGEPPVLESCIFDERDLVQQCGGDTFSSDVDGRLMSRSGADGYDLTWDSEDRLLRVEYADGAVAEHEYDAHGGRIRQRYTTSGGIASVREFLTDSEGDLSHALAETDGAGVTTRYVRAGDMLLGVVRGTERRYIHADRLGSVRLMTDETGLVTDTYEYTPYGVPTGRIGSDPQPYRFAGEAYGPREQFSYNRARWMAPRLGRFLSLDPFDGLAADPATLHRYVYARSNPVRYVDPSGRITLGEVGTALANLSILSKAVLSTTGAGAGAGLAWAQFIRDNSVHMANIMAAEEEFWPEGAPDPYPVTGKSRNAHRADALQHCLAACTVAHHLNPEASEFGGEVWERTARNPKSRNNICDLRNNTVGRQLVEDEGVRSQAGCVRGCRRALRAGELELECNVEPKDP